MCDDETFHDCMKASTFGFPSTKSHVASLQCVKPGAKAFLFHVKKRVLFGPFTVEAVVPPDERDRELWGCAKMANTPIRCDAAARSRSILDHVTLPLGVRLLVLVPGSCGHFLSLTAHMICPCVFAH